MATVTRDKLSSSTNGRPIKVVAIATPGTNVHTHDGTGKDEVYVLLTNTSAAEVETTIELGGAISPDDLVKVLVPAKTTVLALPGVILQGSLSIKAFAASANVINAVGWINKYT